MTGAGTLEPVDVALQWAAIETERTFAVRAKGSHMKLIADIVSDTEDAAGSLSSRAWNASKIALRHRIGVDSGLTWQHEDVVFVREGAQFGSIACRNVHSRRFHDLTILGGIEGKGVNPSYTRSFTIAFAISRMVLMLLGKT